MTTDLHLRPTIKRFMNQAYKKKLRRAGEANPPCSSNSFRPGAAVLFRHARVYGRTTNYARFVADAERTQTRRARRRQPAQSAQPWPNSTPSPPGAGCPQTGKVKSASSDLDADGTDLLVELFGILLPSLLYYKTLNRAMI
jgi:hypothetical protein